MSAKRRATEAKKVVQDLGRLGRCPQTNQCKALAEAKETKAFNQTDMEHIESEYIRNLQQQIYFLELEANYLRDQARKATEMHPQMTQEAERMLCKLREMQSEIDGLQLELKRKESNLEMKAQENHRLTQRHNSEEELFRKEKHVLLDELTELKKEREIIEREVIRRDKENDRLKEEMDLVLGHLHDAQTKNQTLDNEMVKLLEQLRLAKDAIEEQREELKTVQVNYKELEDKYYNSTSQIRDKTIEDLREEVQDMRRRQRDSEMQVEQEHYLREKLQRDMSHLVKENAILSQQLMELDKQLEREKVLRESNDARRSKIISDLVYYKERERSLLFELSEAKEVLKKEEIKVKDCIEEIQMREDKIGALERSNRSLTAKLQELRSLHHVVERSEQQLRREKVLLMDQNTALERKVEDKDEQIYHLKDNLTRLDARLKEQSHLKELEASLHSQKWDEFSRLADSMKVLSKSMSQQQPHNLDN